MRRFIYSKCQRHFLTKAIKPNKEMVLIKKIKKNGTMCLSFMIIDDHKIDKVKVIIFSRPGREFLGQKSMDHCRNINGASSFVVNMEENS